MDSNPQLLFHHASKQGQDNFMGVVSLALLFMMAACSGSSKEEQKSAQADLESRLTGYSLENNLKGYSEMLKPFIEQNKWGFRNNSGIVFIPARYDSIKKSLTQCPNFIIAKRDGKWGLVRADGNETTSFSYDDMEFFSKVSSHWQRSGNQEAPTSVIVKQGNKYGLFDFRKQKSITEVRYDSIDDWPTHSSYRRSIVKVKLNSKYGFVDCATGAEVLPVVYDYLSNPGQNRHFKIKLNNRVGWMDIIDLVVLIKPQYDDVIPVTLSIASDKWDILDSKAKLNGRWGVVDHDEKVVFPFQYDWIDQYSTLDSGVAVVENDSRWGVVNKNGKVIIPFENELSDIELHRTFYNGVHGAILFNRKGNKWGIVNANGLVVRGYKYDSYKAIDGYNSLFGCGQGDQFGMGGGKWCIVDESGNEITPIKYSRIIPPREDYLTPEIIHVISGETEVLVNRKGKEILPAGCLQFKRYESPYVCVNTRELELDRTVSVLVNDKWGVIDLDGKYLVNPVAGFDEVRPPKENLAGASRNSLWGFINPNGDVVIPFKYENVGYFMGGKVDVRLNGKWGVIDRTGKIVEPIKLEFCPVDTCD